MCFTKPSVPKPSALPPAPPAQGADSLILGGGNQDDQLLRNQGVLGRLALMVGRGRAPGGAPAGSSTGGGTGSDIGGAPAAGGPAGGGVSSPSPTGSFSGGGSLSVGSSGGGGGGGGFQDRTAVK